jgi:hypothetical protein
MVAEWLQNQPYDQQLDGRLSGMSLSANRLSHSPTNLSVVSLESEEEEGGSARDSVYTHGDQAILATIYRRPTITDQNTI